MIFLSVNVEANDLITDCNYLSGCFNYLIIFNLKPLKIVKMIIYDLSLTFIILVVKCCGYG